MCNHFYSRSTRLSSCTRRLGYSSDEHALRFRHSAPAQMLAHPVKRVEEGGVMKFTKFTRTHETRNMWALPQNILDFLENWLKKFFRNDSLQRESVWPKPPSLTAQKPRHDYETQMSTKNDRLLPLSSEAWKVGKEITPGNATRGRRSERKLSEHTSHDHRHRSTLSVTDERSVDRFLSACLLRSQGDDFGRLSSMDAFTSHTMPCFGSWICLVTPQLIKNGFHQRVSFVFLPQEKLLSSCKLKNFKLSTTN